MWCAGCRQNVAAIVGDSGDCTLCAVCGAEIDVFADLVAIGRDAVTHASSLNRQTAEAIEPGLPYLACSRARLDHIGRRLDALALHAPVARQRRLDNVAAAGTPKPTVAHTKRTSTWLAGAGLFGGVTALVCGVTLAGWSLASDRAELWNIGLPTALLGQFLLLAALAVQSEFWRKPGWASADEMR
jgi:hypothetical protein